jgi:hypothetical protein
MLGVDVSMSLAAHAGSSSDWTAPTGDPDAPTISSSATVACPPGLERKLAGLDLPDVRETIGILRAAGTVLPSPERPMEMLGRPEGDRCEEGERVITAADVPDLADGARIILR